MTDPGEIRFSREHEWVKVTGELALIGITDYAQDQLGDIVYVDLPEPGTALVQFEKMGEIESVKAVSDLYTPISGEVVRVNDAVVEKPELVNTDPHGDGWLLEVRRIDVSEMEKLLTADEYDAFIAVEQKDEALGP
jgi:glycine cleavage system H protein